MMNPILSVFLLIVAILSGCAVQPGEPVKEHSYTELVKLECTRTLNVQRNENGLQIEWWDTKCRETSKELLLPQQ